MKQKKKNDVIDDKINGHKEDLRMILQMKGHCDNASRKKLDLIIAMIKMKLQRPLIEVEEEKPKPKSPYDE